MKMWKCENWMPTAHKLLYKQRRSTVTNVCMCRTLCAKCTARYEISLGCNGLNINTKAKSLSNENLQMQILDVVRSTQANEWNELHKVNCAFCQNCMHTAVPTLHAFYIHAKWCSVLNVHIILLIECRMWAETCLFSFLPEELVPLCTVTILKSQWIAEN